MVKSFTCFGPRHSHYSKYLCTPNIAAVGTIFNIFSYEYDAKFSQDLNLSPPWQGENALHVEQQSLVWTILLSVHLFLRIGHITFLLLEHTVFCYFRYNFENFCLGILFTNRAFKDLVLGKNLKKIWTIIHDLLLIGLKTLATKSKLGYTLSVSKLFHQQFPSKEVVILPHENKRRSFSRLKDLRGHP